ncbi:hypothetical protein QQS21_005862 [Conoideocrella luteorostrata]|uniref:Mid2 domain-containing protein n=1 Tax=Conoideocrella luteorostrata TaxID=1105319 RepID=A0AAJ0FTG5_9HYPO|nr:hypothetical protein QQS21_005862 [Conoideocrella luteorostrata]
MLRDKRRQAFLTATITVSYLATTTAQSVPTKTTTLYTTITQSPANKRDVPFVTRPDTEISSELETARLGASFVIRPARSLDALAEALALRGLTIVRRATATNTVWTTIDSTTTVTLTETKTDWATQWVDGPVSIESIMVTVIKDANGNPTQTITVQPGATGSSSGADNSSDSGNKLSGGAIAGVVIGSVFGLAITVLPAIWLFRRRRRARKNRNGRTPPIVDGLPTEQRPKVGEHVATSDWRGYDSGTVGVRHYPSAHSSPVQHDHLGPSPRSAHSPYSSPQYGRDIPEMPATRLASPPQELYSHHN